MIIKVLGILLGLALIALGISRYQIVNLQKGLELTEQQKKAAIETNTIFAQKLQLQNTQIEAISKEANANKTKYVELLSRQKPHFEQKEEKIKVIDRVQVTPNACNDIEKLIDAARGK